MKLLRLKQIYCVLFFLSFWVTSCVPIISPYSATAFELTTSLKAESLSVISSATSSYILHEDVVDALVLELSKAMEFAKGRPKNGVAISQWQSLLNPEANLLGGFLQRWQSEDALNAAFVTEAQDNIADAFDLIIRLEVSKLPAGAQY